MTESDLQKLRSEVEVLKKELRRLRPGDSDVQYGDVLDPPVAYDTQELVTNVQIDTTTLKFQKKTRTGWVQFTGAESAWTDWHTGTLCTATPASAAEILNWMGM